MVQQGLENFQSEQKIVHTSKIQPLQTTCVEMLRRRPPAFLARGLPPAAGHTHEPQIGVPMARIQAEQLPEFIS